MKNKLLLFIFLLTLFETLIVFLLEQINIQGFAAVPYYRISTILFVGLFFLKDILFKRHIIQLKTKLNNTDIITLSWVVFSILSFIWGLVKSNPKIYLIADFIYIIFGAIIYFIVTQSNIPSFLKEKKALYYFILLIYILLGINAHISEFVFIFLLGLTYLFLIKKEYLKALLFFIPFIVQISQANRALLLCFALLVLCFFLYKISFYIVKIDRLMIFGILGIVLISFHQEILFLILRIIPENSGMSFRLQQLKAIFLDGIDFNNPFHTSIAQRIVEAQVVTDIWLRNGFTFFLGDGLGAVIDGDLFIDKAVTNTAFLGKNTIHNIHLLPFALLHKYGVLGFVIFIFLSIEAFNAFKNTISKVISDSNRFWNIIYLFIFIYSIPAASFLWTSSLFWISLALKNKTKNA